MSVKSYDAVVIGGGPAGLAAAATAAGQAEVLLIDAAESLGGHFYKSLPDTFAPPPTESTNGKLKDLEARVELLSSHNVEVLLNTRVWGIFQGTETTFGGPKTSATANENNLFTLYLDPPHAVGTRLLIIATGVYDRPIPFPGWSLPGVITPGAAQMLMQKQGLLPGKRVIVAGTGPLQLAVAATLAREGAEVVAVLDACAATAGLSLMPGAMWGQWCRLAEFAGYMASLLKHRLSIRFRQTIFRAIGSSETGVQRAVIGQVDPAGYPIRGTEQSLEADLICSGYGFAPSIAMTLHLGCAHNFDPNLCSYVPDHDEHMRTDVAGVFVAGDVTGVGGQPLAELQGEVAGISALEALGALATQEADSRRRKLLPALKREHRFARMIWQRWPIKPGYFDLVDDDTLVCRCEGITAGQLRQSGAAGAANLFSAKLRTRLGMGVCQGRYCTANAAMLLARATNCPITEVGLPSIRPPLVPVRLKDIASGRV
jgi:NADPH-dependent 2,4-dienoyl-CoA reductase/sulfur reductase-like enzyme